MRIVCKGSRSNAHNIGKSTAVLMYNTTLQFSCLAICAENELILAVPVDVSHLSAQNAVVQVRGGQDARLAEAFFGHIPIEQAYRLHFAALKYTAGTNIR